ASAARDARLSGLERTAPSNSRTKSYFVGGPLAPCTTPVASGDSAASPVHPGIAAAATIDAAAARNVRRSIFADPTDPHALGPDITVSALPAQPVPPPNEPAPTTSSAEPTPRTTLTVSYRGPDSIRHTTPVPVGMALRASFAGSAAARFRAL